MNMATSRTGALLLLGLTLGGCPKSGKGDKPAPVRRGIVELHPEDRVGSGRLDRKRGACG